MKTNEVLVRVIDGNPLDLSIKTLRDAFVGERDGVYKVAISSVRKPKTHEQLEFFFGNKLPIIAKAVGQEEREVYELLLWELARKVVVNERFGAYYHVVRPSEMTVDEMAKFLDDVDRWAASFLGLALPEADPAWKYRIKKAEADEVQE